MTAVCDLTDDLRDAIVEYQVGTVMETYWIIHSYGPQFSQQKAIYEQNCKLIVSRRTCASRIRQILIILLRMLVRHNFHFDCLKLMVQQLNCRC